MIVGADDIDRLRRVIPKLRLDELGVSDRDFVMKLFRRLVADGGSITAEQRKLRNIAICECQRFYVGRTVSGIAKALARDLVDYLKGPWWRRDWCLEPGESPVSAKERALHTVALLNAGKPLAWRSILQVVENSLQEMKNCKQESVITSLRCQSEPSHAEIVPIRRRRRGIGC